MNCQAASLFFDADRNAPAVRGDAGETALPGPAGHIEKLQVLRDLAVLGAHLHQEGLAFGRSNWRGPAFSVATTWS